MKMLKQLGFWVNKTHFVVCEKKELVLIYYINNNFMIGSLMYDFHSLVIKSHELARFSHSWIKNRTSEPNIQ